MFIIIKWENKNTMKILKTLLLVAVAVVICGCSAVKRTVYLQDAENNSAIKAVSEEQIRIKPLDRLTIVVSSKDPELAAPFNATSSYNSLSSNPMGSSTANGASSLQTRTVDENGVLYIPIIGNIYCAGKTRSELSAEIAQKIKNGGYISDAVVNIQFVDMKIFVLGEVERPGQYDITRDHVTILEALAMAGDMTIHGNRQTVTVVRKEEGKTKSYVLNMLDTKMFESPAYYLQQNDVVYVQPNKYKAATAEINQNRNFWLSIATTFLSVASLVVTILAYTK